MRFVQIFMAAAFIFSSALAFSEDAGMTQKAHPEVDALLAELDTSLFGETGGSKVDEKLLESIHEDLDSIEFKGDPKGEETVNSIFGSNPLTGKSNPLVHEQARKRWLSTAIAAVGVKTVSKHLRAQAAALKEGKITRAEWYEHVAHCTKICNPVVQGLLYEHVRQVSSHPHLLLTFQSGSDKVTAGDEKILKTLVGRAADLGARFLLIGRASRVGPRQYNRELSARRVEAVRSELKKQGIASDAISGFWLGYEAPQITDEISQVYRLAAKLGDIARNQSVMVVAYR